jgi:hypothetical protein
MVAVPTVPLAVPPLGWMVVLVTTVPARPLAVPPVVGVPTGVYPLPAAKAVAGMANPAAKLSPTEPANTKASLKGCFTRCFLLKEMIWVSLNAVSANPS